MGHGARLLVNPFLKCECSAFKVLDVFRRDMLKRVHLLHHPYVARCAYCPVAAKRTRPPRGLYLTLDVPTTWYEMRSFCDPEDAPRLVATWLDEAA